jgi:hypothetical protein
MEGEMVVKEISPKELQELNSKSFKNTQKIFRRRLREIAKGGEIKAKYKEDDYCAGEYIKGWLRGLGFTCKEIGYGGWVEITWPETEAPDKKKEWHMMVQKGDHKQSHPDADCLKSGKPAWYLYHWKNDPIQWDYICSCCDEHSEYQTKFCPNCGAKRHIEEGKNGT